MNSQDVTETSVYIECLELYLQHGGSNILAIEREMRARGHAFNRRTLYKRGKTPGWIERFNWQEKCRSPRVSSPGVSSPHVSKGSSQQDTDGSNRSNGAKIPAADQTPSVAPVPSSHASPASPLNSDFRAWLRTVSPKMNWNWRHHRHICDQLERFTRGEIKRLMLFLPPRHGKSELVTVRYAAWRLKQDPEMNVIVAGYGQRLANRFSRKVRNVLAEAATKDINRDEQDKEDIKNGIGTAMGSASALNGNGNSGPHQVSTSSSSHSSLLDPADGQPPTANVRQPSCPCCSPGHARRINTVAEWETHAGGGFRAVGVGGSVTGFGANLIIIDDPIKSRQQAESKTYRDRTWEWFNDDISTRLEPDGGIILIQTRWHEDDLAGRLIRDMENGGDQWTVISLPAIAEPKGESIKNEGESQTAGGGPHVYKSEQFHRDKGDEVDEEQDTRDSGNKAALQGDETPATGSADQDMESGISNTPSAPLEPIRPFSSSHPSPSSLLISSDWRLPGEALCPERFPVEELEKLRRQLGTYSYSALYQQSPTPRDGGLFKLSWFSRIVESPPPGLEWARGYDLAVSTNSDADYTASFRCAYGKDGTLYIDGGFRDRIEYPDQRRYLLGRLADEPDTKHGIELALHGQAFLQDLRRERGSRGHMLKGVKVGTDKMTRELSWAPLAEEGKVALVRGAWNADFVDEAASFPHGTHDDQIDAVSIAVGLLAQRSAEAYGF